jgi:hypothetical protein
LLSFLLSQIFKLRTQEIHQIKLLKSLSLGVKLGGLGHKTFMSKLKQPDNNSNKNRGGQARSVARFATILLFE